MRINKHAAAWAVSLLAAPVMMLSMSHVEAEAATDLEPIYEETVIGLEQTKLSGWQQIDDNWYYYDEETGLPVTENRRINGIMYKFNHDGTHTEATPDISADGLRYYFAGQVVKGWFTNEYGTFYYGEDGIALTGWQEIEGYWYFFDSISGAMATSDVRRSGITFKIEPDGKHLTGVWKTKHVGVETISQYWLHGTYMTGWQEIDGNVYYFDNTGCMKTGTRLIDDCVFILADDGVLVSDGVPVEEYTGLIRKDEAYAEITCYYEQGVRYMGTGYKVIDGVSHFFIKGIMIT